MACWHHIRHIYSLIDGERSQTHQTYGSFVNFWTLNYRSIGLLCSWTCTSTLRTSADVLRFLYSLRTRYPPEVHMLVISVKPFPTSVALVSNLLVSSRFLHTALSDLGLLSCDGCSECLNTPG